MEKTKLSRLEKSEQSRVLAQDIQSYLSQGNPIQTIPSGMTGWEAKHNGFIRRTFIKGKPKKVNPT